MYALCSLRGLVQGITNEIDIRTARVQRIIDAANQQGGPTAHQVRTLRALRGLERQRIGAQGQQVINERHAIARQIIDAIDVIAADVRQIIDETDEIIEQRIEARAHQIIDARVRGAGIPEIIEIPRNNNYQNRENEN